MLSSFRNFRKSTLHILQDRIDNDTKLDNSQKILKAK